MLLTPRTYSLGQVPDAGCNEPRSSFFLLTKSRKEQRIEEQRVQRMLLLHQTGSVKVGEVVRYTLTYTPSEDRILPPPAFLHVKIKNCSAIALRAAYLHGPYTLYVAAYPSTFNPNKKVDSPKKEGVPEFEPNLKAGASFTARLAVPEHIRESISDIFPARAADGTPKSVTWIIEISSQILFSHGASVSYELLVARDEKALDLGFAAITGNTQGLPGQVHDHQQGKHAHPLKHAAQPKGIYSKAVNLVVDDTASLWNKPALPEWNNEETSRRGSRHAPQDHPEEGRKQKKIHVVIVTHGLHSNLGADMLYLKESIDATAKRAREGRKQRRRDEAQSKPDSSKGSKDTSTAPLSGGQDEIDVDDDDDDEEEVVVRGFERNVIRTERGIQYLGKRLAKYVLKLTYPDQPYLPVKRSMSQKISSPFSPTKAKTDEGIPGLDGAGAHDFLCRESKRAYKYTSISFIGHSLGGLVQTYAIAYIYKHSPHFFETIQPINFIGLASPFLGLSNENPMYVKFALDFGLVGRTGQDLGLTWRAPTLAKSGWSAMVSGLGAQSQKEHQQTDPGAKPLLRILPTGPAHLVLRMFRNRTLYSNVVNDGIVPLRTSCLLFLDWRGLGKVEKARRDNGLIGTVAGWGWGQLTGQNSSPIPSRISASEDENEDERVELFPLEESPRLLSDDTSVPQPGVDVTNEDDEAQLAATEPTAHQFLGGQKRDSDGPSISGHEEKNALMTLWSYIRPSGRHTSKDKKMFKRSQTILVEPEEHSSASSDPYDSRDPERSRKRPTATRGDTLHGGDSNVAAPPKTTIFESAGDLLSPPVPPTSWIIDPSTRARTIFHDRIYHPEDIPPPPSKRPKIGRSFSSESSMTQTSMMSEGSTDEGGMRVEEKIARAYHKDLSWRKVLVRLEPDAHNNLVVRRMFANAYGWPVIKHLCDTHFADTYSAQTRDEDESAQDRAKDLEEPVREEGEHVRGQDDLQPPIERTTSELQEVGDELAPLAMQGRNHAQPHSSSSLRSKDSANWDDLYFDGTSDEDEDDQDDRNVIQRFLQPQSKKAITTPTTPQGVGTSEADIADFLLASPRAPSIEGHRGLGPTPRQSRAGAREPDSLESMGGCMPSMDGEPSNPPLTPSGNMVDIGLRRELDRTATTPSPSSPHQGRARSGSGGVTEQVARLSFTKDGQ